MSPESVRFGRPWPVRVRRMDPAVRRMDTELEPGALRHNRLELPLFRTLGDLAAQAGVPNPVGRYHALLGDRLQALTDCFEALTMLRDPGDRHGRAAATRDTTSHVPQHLRRPPQALPTHHVALTLPRALGASRTEAGPLARFGDTHRAMGDGDSARAAWTDAALRPLRAPDHRDAGRVGAGLTGPDGHADVC